MSMVNLRDAAYTWMGKFPRDSYFELADLYLFIRTSYPDAIEIRGFTPDGEEKWKKDARWAIQDALGKTPGRTKIIVRSSRARYLRV